MTTLAYRDGILAADSQITHNNVRYAHARKVARLPNNALVAVCGSLISGERFMRFLQENEGELTDQAIRSCRDMTALYVVPNGDVLIIEGGKFGGAAPLVGEFFADGSGYVAALAAMKAGADAVRAIEIAAELDTNTALPVVYERLGATKRTMRRKKA